MNTANLAGVLWYLHNEATERRACLSLRLRFSCGIDDSDDAADDDDGDDPVDDRDDLYVDLQVSCTSEKAYQKFIRIVS